MVDAKSPEWKIYIHFALCTWSSIIYVPNLAQICIQFLLFSTVNSMFLKGNVDC